MYYPVGLKVKGEDCLVVGGGKVAFRKALALVRAGARVRLVAPEIDPRLNRKKGITPLRRPFSPRDVNGAFLVVSATDDEAVNRRVHAICRRNGTLVNVVDRPELCTFIVPAMLRRGNLTIAVSTEGGSPGLAQGLRKELEKLYPKSFQTLARFLSRTRRKVIRALPNSKKRMRLLARLASPQILSAARRGKLREVVRKIRARLLRRGVRA